MKNKILALILASVFLLVVPIAHAETVEENITEPAFFKDVQPGNDYFTAIQYLKKADLLPDNDEFFYPDEEIGRAETIYYILKIILGYEPAKNEKILKRPFQDVPEKSVLAPYIQKAKELHLISVNPKFYPRKKVALAEALKMILETEKLINGSIKFEQPIENVFSDVPAEAWFSTYAKIAKTLRIIKFGRSDEMEPAKPLTSSYLMEILYRLNRSHQGYNFGIASYYHGSLNGGPTSSGEKFSNKAFTAAHRTLPLGTRIRVTNLRNEKSVEVIINDRGPYTKNFTLDLSQAAFSELAPKSQGIIPIEYIVIE